MKNRLLAAFISISMIFSGIPVSAAEPVIDSGTGANLEDTAITDDNGSADENSQSGSDNGDSSGAGGNNADSDNSGSVGSDESCENGDDNIDDRDNASDGSNGDNADNYDNADADAGNDDAGSDDTENGGPAADDTISDAEQAEDTDAPETLSDNSVTLQSNEQPAAAAQIERSIASVEVSTTYRTATFTALINGCDAREYTTSIFVFYRERGSSASWDRASGSTKEAVCHFEETVQGLEENTAYDYVMVLSDWYRSTPDEVKGDDVKKEGTFITKTCDYTVEIAKKDKMSSSREAVLSVTGKNITDINVLKLTLTLSDGQKQETTLRKEQGYQKDVTFTGLAGGTKYTITDAVFTIREGTKNRDLTAVKAEGTAYYEFTTAEGEAPTSIKLAEEKIGLNVLYSSETEAYEGFNTKKLTVVTEPEVPAAELKWESSNAAVATVNEKGEVRVIGASATPVTITVSSRYDPSVKASCEVIAKRYVIGGKTNNGSVNEIKKYGGEITLYKGESASQYRYYEMNAAGSCTELSGDFNVTFSNPAVASWSGGSLKGEAVGETDVIFEKEGVRSLVTLRVNAVGKNFAITDVKPGNADNRYAVREGDDNYLLAYSVDDAKINSYQASVRIIPGGYANRRDFEWTTSNPAVAQVDETGKVTVKGAGTTLLTIKPKKYHTIDGAPYEQESAAATLTVRALPPQKGAALYALANTTAKLRDVAFPESWGEGWEWKYPDTPLVTNGVYGGEYEFEAVYKGDTYFGDERTVSVKIGKITSIDLSEPRGITSHNHVVEVSDNTMTADYLTLDITPGYQGYEPPADGAHYTIEVPDVQGLEIKEIAFDRYSVRALKKGNYTLRPVIKAPGANGKVLAKTTYQIKAVPEKQAASMKFSVDGSGYLTTDQTGDYFLTYDVTANQTDVILKAEVINRNGDQVDTALTWKSADQKVATVAPVTKTDTHSAKVTIKGSGDVAITVQAKDAAGAKAKINLTVRDHTPRIDKNRLTVNMAYDYSKAVGKRYAADAGGTVEIVPAYGEIINKVELRQKGSEQAAQYLTIESHERKQYLVRPSAGITTGVYDCDVYVETDAQTAEGKTASYTYPLKVTVIDKAPKPSVQMGVVPNLFYTNMEGTILIKMSGYQGGIESGSMSWKDNSSGNNNGFSLEYNWYDAKAKAYMFTLKPEPGLTVTGTKLADENVAKGTISFKLDRYQKIYTFENFVIRYKYQKPVLVTKNASSSVILSAGQNKGHFEIYSKTDKSYLKYNTAANANYPYYYDEITTDCGDMVIDRNESFGYQDDDVDFTYNGKETKQKVKVKLTLSSRFWREDLTVEHTVKVVKPAAYLKYKSLTFNAAARGAIYNEVLMKDTDNAKYHITFTDMEIKGADQKAQKLLDGDRLFIAQDGKNYVNFAGGNAIKVEQGQDLGKNPIAPGNYSYKITPYYKKPGTNERTALNTLTLTVRVINKPVTAKVSPKGMIDLLRVDEAYEKKNQVVLVDPKFGSLSDGYEIRDYKLQGEYSQYFELKKGEITYGGKKAEHYYICPKSKWDHKLKAGQTYKLSIVYTLRLNYAYGFDESVTVTSNTFRIRPKQSVPVIKVRNNNQTLYAGAHYQLNRAYYLSVPEGYSVKSITGSIDCNKDGRADIEVSGYYYDTDRSLHYTVAKITDRHAVQAATNGKTYTIPVTVTFNGRDGVSRDAKFSIKVKIKR